MREQEQDLDKTENGQKQEPELQRDSPAPEYWRPVRDENGWGQLRLERVAPYVPTRESTTALLNTVSKAWPVLAEHASYMDGTFDLALTDLRRAVEALHDALAAAPLRCTELPRSVDVLVSHAGERRAVRALQCPPIECRTGCAARWGDLT